MRVKTRACFSSGALSGGAYIMLLILVLMAPSASAGNIAGDEFLKGYIASVLEQDMGWSGESYRLEVAGGVAKITLPEDDPARRDAAMKRLGAIERLGGVTIIVASSDKENIGADHSAGKETVKGVKGQVFPKEDLFRPLIADPKQPQFFVSLDRFRSPGDRYNMGEAGFGETFGLYRFGSDRGGNGLQISVEASIVARFNMDTPSSNLVNADYTIGFPLTYRRGRNSFRLRLYHQSSHLGDEYLESPDPPKRVNLSYEAVEFIYSRGWRRLRVYAGGEYIVRGEPSELKPASGHFGIEYIGSRKLLKTGRLIGGIDWKSYEEHSWKLDTSVKLGIEFGLPNPGQRRLRVLAEWYRGHDPRGQFYMNKVSYCGLNLSLGF